jgi:hypothetical protein
MLAANRSDHHVSLLQSVLGRQKNVFCSPERLSVNKIDAVLRPIAFALARIELEFHRSFGTASAATTRLFVSQKRSKQLVAAWTCSPARSMWKASETHALPSF